MSEEPSTALISPEAALKAQREALRSQLGTAPTNKISTDGKVFKLPNGEKDPGPMQAVILDFAWMLVHYKGAFRAGQPQPPDCWAIGRDVPDRGLLKPDKSIEKPYGSDCGSCPKNQWGSASTGRGKACKNQRRLVLVAPDATENTTILTLYVSPFALKNWDKYVDELDKVHGKLPVQVITEISFDPTHQYPTLQFAYKAPHNNLQLMFNLQQRAQEQLFRPIEINTPKAA